MIDSLQSENTLMASMYSCGIQARELKYDIFVAWKNLVNICLLHPGQKYHHIHNAARSEYVRGYKNGKAKD